MDVDEVSSQTLWPIHKGLVLIAYANSEGSNEAVHSHSLARAFPDLTKKEYNSNLRPILWACS